MMKAVEMIPKNSGTLVLKRWNSGATKGMGKRGFMYLEKFPINEVLKQDLNVVLVDKNETD